MLPIQLVIAAIISALMFIPTLGIAGDKLIFSGIEGTNSDIALQVLKEAYRKLDKEIELKPYPIIRAIKSADTGIVDGELFKTKEIEGEYTNLIRVPVPVNYIEIVVIAKKDKISPTGWESLRPYKIGIYRGAVLAKKRTKKAGCKYVYEVYDHEMLLKMIQSDRIDLAIVAKIAGMKLLRDAKVTEIVITQPPLDRVPVYHFLHKKNEIFIPQLTTILEKMNKEGRIAQVRDELFQQEFQQ